MHGIVAQWVQYKPVLCVDEACDGDGDGMIRITHLRASDREAHALCSKRLGLSHACDSSSADSGPVEFVLVEERS